ncbi:MAG TPA: tetratricopeptide repeat protein [Terriglobales bacterium]|nr:tetratricopeptide repeat protein [Terriglobales bacterium]
MYRRLGRTAEARSSYEKALALTPTGTGAAIPASADSPAEIKIGVAVDFPSPQRRQDKRTMSYVPE